ncbi:hypothetical protein DFH27DRAFT_82065 [Peziza echinospora]|nr:hypothetical protein DFH27DRAFT_82065 [Peziza echinospora]
MMAATATHLTKRGFNHEARWYGTEEADWRANFASFAISTIAFGLTLILFLLMLHRELPLARRGYGRPGRKPFRLAFAALSVIMFGWFLVFTGAWAYARDYYPNYAPASVDAFAYVAPALQGVCMAAGETMWFASLLYILENRFSALGRPMRWGVGSLRSWLWGVWLLFAVLMLVRQLSESLYKGIKTMVVNYEYQGRYDSDLEERASGSVVSADVTKRNAAVDGFSKKSMKPLLYCIGPILVIHAFFVVVISCQPALGDGLGGAIGVTFSSIEALWTFMMGLGFYLISRTPVADWAAGTPEALKLAERLGYMKGRDVDVELAERTENVVAPAPVV